MVIDTSAIIAIMFNETTAPRLVAAIEQSPVRMISAGTVIETALVLLGRYGPEGEVHLDTFLRGINADIVPCDADQVTVARDAARAYGRGRHRAALNFGDCFSYALAVARDQALLFVGEDFAQTDVSVAPW
ncbi:MAG: type II toxin-antitoxin system VapC family toxin [Gemmatimonadaceae bacterium]